MKRAHMEEFFCQFSEYVCLFAGKHYIYHKIMVVIHSWILLVAYSFQLVLILCFSFYPSYTIFNPLAKTFSNYFCCRVYNFLSGCEEC